MCPFTHSITHRTHESTTNESTSIKDKSSSRTLNPSQTVHGFHFLFAKPRMSATGSRLHFPTSYSLTYAMGNFKFVRSFSISSFRLRIQSSSSQYQYKSCRLGKSTQFNFTSEHEWSAFDLSRRDHVGCMPL